MTQPLIYTALAKVMAEVGAVAKTKKNVQQGYQFRGVDDVMAHCQQVMAAHGVVPVPRVVNVEREMVDTKSGGRMASVRLTVDHTFYAADGSHVVCTTLGEAMDSGDKASNKAMSAALKYALTETFLIPTYEVERDTEEASPVVVAPPQPRPVTSAPASPPKAQPVAAAEAPKARRLVIQDSGDDVAAIRACSTMADLDALRKAKAAGWDVPTRAEWGIKAEALRKAAP